MDPAKFTSFLVKVASRCNLDCDYCYVYHHADQSWRSMPKLLSAKHQEAFAQRLKEYSIEAGLSQCVVVFHGGEPLLSGVQTLVNFAKRLRKTCDVPVDVSMQTNGLLLTEDALSTLALANIGVSLSLDGPKTANDKHRLTHKGLSSFQQTEQALTRLQQYPSIFSGVISVIDASTEPRELFEYFDQFQLPSLDFLLPDAHWLRPPPGRDEQHDLYEKWLVKAFDIWFEQYSHIPVRTFEALLDACTGLPSGTDAFGFGDVSLLSIETDGSYHDLDVLKVTKDGATQLFGNVLDTPIAEVARSTSIKEHRKHLRMEGLASECQSCDIVEICGGGSLPHRFCDDGFMNPTVYCQEMKLLVSHVQQRIERHLVGVIESPVTEPLPKWLELEKYERAELAQGIMDKLCASARIDSRGQFLHALGLFSDDDLSQALISLNGDLFDYLAVYPGSVAWSNAVIAQHNGQALLTVGGKKVEAQSDYLKFLLGLSKTLESPPSLSIGLEDPWLRIPFEDSILFEDEELAFEGRSLVNNALAIVHEWRPELLKEMLKACGAIQFVRDPAADPSRIISFSDNSVPGALYVSITQADGLVDQYDLADSLIHEHRHQKLYLLERQTPMVKPTSALVTSPWRKDLRPPSGLLHAVFVFVELRRYWLHILSNGPEVIRSRAINQIADTNRDLQQAFATLETCPLTEAGQRLVEVLKGAAMEGYELHDHYTYSDSTVQTVL